MSCKNVDNNSKYRIVVNLCSLYGTETSYSIHLGYSLQVLTKEINWDFQSGKIIQKQ